MPSFLEPTTALLYGDQSALLSEEKLNNQTIILHQEVSIPLSKLCQALATDDLPIVIVSHWRSFQHQANIWNRKWQGATQILDRNGSALDSTQISDNKKLESICFWSAIPGTSRHHWGTDFDIFLAKPIEQGHQVQLIPDEFADKSLCLDLHQWLEKNLTKFGFFRPYRTERGGVSIEPWHISYQPIAQKLLPLLQPEHVIEKLNAAQVSGSEIISHQIDNYFEQFILNIDST